jgi:hypothetical protein
LRRQAVERRDVTASRDHWRAKYLQLRHPGQRGQPGPSEESPLAG